MFLQLPSPRFFPKMLFLFVLALGLVGSYAAYVNDRNNELTNGEEIYPNLDQNRFSRGNDVVKRLYRVELKRDKNETNKASNSSNPLDTKPTWGDSQSIEEIEGGPYYPPPHPGFAPFPQIDPGFAPRFDPGFNPGYNPEFSDFWNRMRTWHEQMQNELQRQLNAAQQNSIPYGDPNFGPSFAASNVQFGPGGGYQSGVIGPVSSPDIASRFGEEIPPGGQVYGVFSSSSSSDSVGPDGQRKTKKISTTGVNKDGQWQFRTIQDP